MEKCSDELVRVFDAVGINKRGVKTPLFYCVKEIIKENKLAVF